MLGLTWFKNMSWRTLIAFVPSLAKPDDVFAKSRLNEREYELYASMDKRDRAHACAVAKHILKTIKDPSTALIKAAFLHDIGKADGRYNPFERILVHLYMPKTIPIEPRYKGMRGVWQKRQHHAYYGATSCREAGISEEIALIVEQHHDFELNQSKAITEDAKQLSIIESQF